MTDKIELTKEQIDNLSIATGNTQEQVLKGAEILNQNIALFKGIHDAGKSYVQKIVLAIESNNMEEYHKQLKELKSVMRTAIIAMLSFLPPQESASVLSSINLQKFSELVTGTSEEEKIHDLMKKLKEKK